jgi:asparagine synthase (glutamine-hydrolysing)
MLSQRLMAWSRIKRRPWIQLLFQSLVLLLPPKGRAWCDARARVAPWVDADFARSHHLGMKQLGPQGGYGFWRPSRCDYARTVAGIRRQTSFLPQHVLGHEERRFPYLDQTLVEFLLSIPATQLLRPGQRRSLMRRSLVSIVPSEILWRRTKGAVARGVLASLENSWSELDTLFFAPLSARLGYIKQTRLREGLRAAKNGDAPQLVRLLRVICLELWLRSLVERGVLRMPQERLVSVESSLTRQEAGAS